MTDIISSVPWCCGERECETQWHLANYWIDGNEFTVDNYADGDHETVEEKDLPTAEDERKAWGEYYAYVARTGLDPLNEFANVKRARQVRERWQFRFAPSIVGVVLARARRGKREYSASTLPPHVREYLTLGPTGNRLEGFESANEAYEAGLKFNKWNTEVMMHTEMRPDETVEAELRRAARKALKERR